MKRRWVGILLLMLAVISLVAVQALKGGRVEGTAAAAPVPAPPRVGDCLLYPLTLTEAQTISSQKPWATGSCADTWYGEVTAVIENPVDRASWPHSAGSLDELTNAADPAFVGCQVAAYDYVGAAVSESPMVEWSPALRVGSVAIDPSAWQQAVGQQWRACVVYVFPEEFEGAAGAPALTHTLRDINATGAMADSLGICMSDAGLTSFDYLECSQPHTIQLVAMGTVNQPVQRTDPVAGCAALAHQLTARPDLETAGELEIDVRYVDFGQGGPLPAAVDDAEIRVGIAAMCLIRSPGGRQLGGSLLGLGDRPIPWS